jgi:NAD-dependent deacetylase
VSIDRAVETLADRQRILVYTGAGISTESGIPDFRGPDGLWTRVDPDDFTIDRYVHSRERRIQDWRMHSDGALWGARSEIEPNPAHHAITDLWRAGLTSGVITQNVDGLHLVAGLPRTAISEIHGDVRRVVCLGCAAEQSIEPVLERVDAGEQDPLCLACGGMLKPATVMFGELLPPSEIAKAERFSQQADAVLVVGSTVSVYPAADFPLSVRRRGAPMVIVNQGRTDHDAWAEIKIDGLAGEVVPEIVDRLTARSH